MPSRPQRHGTEPRPEAPELLLLCLQRHKAPPKAASRLDAPVVTPEGEALTCAPGLQVPGATL